MTIRVIQVYVQYNKRIIAIDGNNLKHSRTQHILLVE